MDELTGPMNEAIKIAFHQNCKEKKNKGGKGKPERWNENLTRLKRDAWKARRKYIREHTEENRIAKYRAEHSYKSELKKAKNESWREYCSRAEDTTAVARLHRLMKNGRLAEIGTLKRSDGTYTNTQAETLTELLDALLPIQEHDEQHNVDDFLTQENTGISEETIARIVNDTTVSEIVNRAMLA